MSPGAVVTRLGGAQGVFYAAGAALVLVAVVYVWRRGFQGVAADTTRAAANLAGGAVVGTVKGVGDVIGIPDTDKSKCERALAEGRYWDASFDCPAGDFIKGVFSSSPPSAPAPSGAMQNSPGNVFEPIETAEGYPTAFGDAEP